MTRLTALILAASLITSPVLAGGFGIDLPNLTFPEIQPVTPSTSGATTADPVQPQD